MNEQHKLMLIKTSIQPFKMFEGFALSLTEINHLKPAYEYLEGNTSSNLYPQTACNLVS